MDVPLTLRRFVGLVTSGAALARFVAGCTVGTLPLDGKQCPCVAGYTCDTTQNRCVPTTVQLDGAVPDASSPAPATLTVRRFAASWSTSKSIRWEWEVAGDSAAFAEYQIIVGSTEDAVLRQSSETVLFDRRVNPELAAFSRTSGGDGVATSWTVTDQHVAATKVFGRLVVRTTSGEQIASSVASIDTLSESQAVALFADQLDEGAVPTPSALVHVTYDCYLKSPGCLQYPGIVCGDAEVCPVEIGVAGLAKSATGMSAETFDRAFVELAVRRGQIPPSKASADVIVTIGGPACRIGGSPCRFRARDTWSFRPNAKEYRLVQLPLRAFVLDTPSGGGPTMTFEDLAANGMLVESVAIDGEWPTRFILGLDHLHLRW